MQEAVKMLRVSALLVLLAFYGARSELSGDRRCIKTSQELEKSLVERSSNMDSMRDAFYPANRQAGNAVNVYYYINDGNISRYDEKNSNFTYSYAFRWSTSPVFQFIRPELLQYLSLFTYHGRTTTLKIVIDPLCEDVPLQRRELDEETCNGERGSSDPALMLNTLTVHLKSYVRDNRLIGVDEKSQGCSSYLYNRNNLKDHCVIGQDNLFERLRIYIFLILFSLPIVVAIVLPPLTVTNYIRIRKRMMKEGSNMQYYVWAIAIASIMFNCFILGIASYIGVSGFQENTANTDVKWYYFLSFCVAMVYPIINWIITALATLYYNMNRVMRQNPIPCPSPCCNHRVSIFAVYTGIATIAFTIQLLFPMSFYIILALIVSPVHTCSFLLLYTAGMLCLVVFIAIFLKALHSKCRGIVLVFIGIIAFVLLYIFIIAFMEVMISFGDYSSNDGVLSIIGSIAETLMLSALAYAGNKILKSFGPKQEELTNQEKSNLSNEPDVRANKDMPKKRNTSSNGNS